MRHLLPALLIFLPPAAAQTHARSLVPACNSSQLSLTTEARAATLATPAHPGTLLVLRNSSAQACSISAKPLFQFNGKDGKRLDMNYAIPAGVRNTSLLLPDVVVPPGAEATARMTWVSTESSAQPRCLDTTTILLDFDLFGGDTIEAPLAAHICGPPRMQVTYLLEPFHRDSLYKP